MNQRGQNIKRMLLKERDGCELCGSKRSLEVHHIIPLVLQPEGIDLNVEDNMIVVCHRCHAMLTPKNLLVKMGINKKRDKMYQFWNILDKYEGYFDIEDVFETVEEVWG